MKVLTVFGTRPEIIRLSLVIPAIDRHAEQFLVHTGQNYDPLLSDVFFEELGLRQPDAHLGIRSSSFHVQAAAIIERIGDVLDEVRPDRLLVLGDTNSGLAALVAARKQIPVFHMEAGNRAYDDRIPEEVNRRVIDHCSTVLLPYTQRSKENLVREGIERERIFVTGNPIFEVLKAFEAKIDAATIMDSLSVTAGRFMLATLHRAENVDDPVRLGRLLDGLSAVANEHEMLLLVSTHPRTAAKLRESGHAPSSDRVKLLQPMGFFDFVRLEKNAALVLSDSGTVQEECCIFGVPAVTLRDVTERPETIECGSNVLSGGDPSEIARIAGMVLRAPAKWTPPAEYLQENVAATVARIVLGYSSIRRHFEHQ